MVGSLNRQLGLELAWESTMVYSISTFFGSYQAGLPSFCRCLFCKCQTHWDNGSQKKPNHLLLQKKRVHGIISPWVECKIISTLKCENREFWYEHFYVEKRSRTKDRSLFRTVGSPCSLCPYLFPHFSTSGLHSSPLFPGISWNGFKSFFDLFLFLWGISNLSFCPGSIKIFL